MPLNEKAPMKIFCIRHWIALLLTRKIEKCFLRISGNHKGRYEVTFHL